MEERFCGCGEVQDEMHVIEVCPLTAHIRQEFDFETFQQLIHENSDYPITEIVYKILQCFE